MLVTGPIDIVKSRVQTAPEHGPQGVQPAVQSLLAEAKASGKGVLHFYRGVGTAMCRGIPVMTHVAPFTVIGSCPI